MKKKKSFKVPTGIPGFDELSYGGIPKGRTTLVSGVSGSGKTVFAAQFLYGGILSEKENGVFVTFEEKPTDIMKNMSSFGWNIKDMVKKKKWVFVDASPDDSESLEIGAFDLGGLLARIKHAVKKAKAKRVAIDSISALFPRYEDSALIRRELFKIGQALKDMGITAILTAERVEDKGQIGRFGVEEFVSDNVILLHNHLRENGERERTIEVLKFRGAPHSSSEAQLMVTNRGMEVFPKPTPVLSGKGFDKKISFGIPGIDKMLLGGVYKNSITLLSGPSGSGKTVSTLHFIMQGSLSNEKSLLIEFEESTDQLYRNAASFGWDLKATEKKGLVTIVNHYPEDFKAEQYLKYITSIIVETKATRVAIDSLSALQRVYKPEKFRQFMIGLNSVLKMNNCTTLLTNTTQELLGLTQITETQLSTSTDNIVVLKYAEIMGEMKKLVAVLKQRGSGHDKALREYEVTSSGIIVGKSYKAFEGLLSGQTRKTMRTTEELLKQEFVKTLGTTKGLKNYLILSKKGINSTSIANEINRMIKALEIKADKGQEFRDRLLMINEGLSE